MALRSVLVERKTLDDFVCSVLDARLFRQASRLARAAQPAVIVLEGTATSRRHGLGREQIQGALVTLSLVFGLPVLRTRDPHDTVWLFRAIARQAGRRVAKGLTARKWNPRDTDARRIHVLASCPDIGPGRAAALLMHFGTLAAIFSATEPELRAVHGLGPQTAATLHAFFHRPTPAPGAG